MTAPETVELAMRLEASGTQLLGSVAQCMTAFQTCAGLCRENGQGKLAGAVAEAEAELRTLLARLLVESRSLTNLASAIAWVAVKEGGSGSSNVEKEA